MKNYVFIITLVVVFNYLIEVTFAKNNYYIIGIRRDVNDKNYDDESTQIQQAINELVNERMNDIYNIIENNRDTYILENGEMDEKLDELDSIGLIKRSNPFKDDHEVDNSNTMKFIFIDNKRNLHQQYKRSDNLIPFKSYLVDHICPIQNYYTVRAYLSEAIVPKVEVLPNVIFCGESVKSKPQYILNKPFQKYLNNGYDIEVIKKETNWTDVEVQIHNTLSGTNFFSHLSLTSQSPFKEELTEEYDNNYYYPKTAGKGIDIFFIDGGFKLKDKDEYNTYSGTSDERTITCDVGFLRNEKYDADPTFCDFLNDNESAQHGNMVMSSAGGTIFGIAKKANLHMVASGYESYDDLNALDYILQHGTPYKTIVSISRSMPYSQAMEDKINELSDYGFVIFISAGNESANCCNKNDIRHFNGYEKAITVGAIANTLYEDMGSDKIYSIASYSNYGDCVDIFGPGQSICPYIYGIDDYDEYNGFKYLEGKGTSTATPLVAGVAALIMAEQPNIQYNTEVMKQIMIDLSIKDVIKGLDPSTPNRFVNNGKHVVFSPNKKYHGCGQSAGNMKCSEGCCSADGHCIDASHEDYSTLCAIDHGCQSEFGECLTTSTDREVDSPSTSTTQPTTTLGQRCGPGYGSCVLQDANGKYLHVSCCSKEGVCGLTREYCGYGCQTDFGRCYAIAFLNRQ